MKIYLIHKNKYKEEANWKTKKQTPYKRTRNSPEKLDEMEASNLLHKEFRVMIIRILSSMKKDIETIKKDQSEIKNAIFEINNTVEGINSRLDEAEDRIRNLEDKVEKNTQVEQQKEKRIF